LVFEPAPLDGAWILDLERQADDRGFFARAWCRREFEARGLVADLVQANVAHSRRKGTIRGLHYQVAPFQETKLVRCVRGAICDVIVDLRPESATYLQWFGTELTAENRRQLYVPKDFAHGYQTLVDDSEVFYQLSAFYAAHAERGIRWNDPLFAIAWPVDVTFDVSPKDQAWPDFTPQRPPGAGVQEWPAWSNEP
jgi:dTDP-4-dehydrorhamnose 3,5-epimerase